MDVQNVQGRSALAAVRPQAPKTVAVASAAAASALPPPGAAVGAGAIPPVGPPAVGPAALEQATSVLQKQVSQQAPSVALTTGLNPDGMHPGQLLVELKDRITQQVFVRYYIPAEQLAKVAAPGGDSTVVAPGSLLQDKA